MTNISIIGAGNMARAIGSLTIKGGGTVEIVSRDATKAQALAQSLGDGATTGTWGAAPAGDIVILAVPYQGAVPVTTAYGDALADKIIVDITNPFNADGSGLALSEDTSVSQLIAEVAPPSAHVVKAFNTLFGHVLAAGNPVDVFMAGDDVQAKASVSEWISRMGLRPRDAGDLRMAHWLEGAGLLEMGLARNGLGFGISLSVNTGETE